MARRHCSSGRDAWVEAVKSALRVVRRARGPGRRETHTREMGRSLGFPTRDPRHGDQDPVGERVILTGLCFPAGKPGTGPSSAGRAPAGLVSSRKNRRIGGGSQQSQKRLHNGADDGSPEESWPVGSRTGHAHEEEGNIKHTPVWERTRPRPLDRACANASRNPDGLIQCTILRLHRCVYAPSPWPRGGAPGFVLSAVENALLQVQDFTTTYEEPLSRHPANWDDRSIVVYYK